MPGGGLYITFDWKSLLGTPPGQKPAKAFGYKNARTTEQWKECGEELKLRLKENLQAKIAPVAKAYGMKKAGPKTFVREKNGLVSRIQKSGHSGKAFLVPEKLPRRKNG